MTRYFRFTKKTILIAASILVAGTAAGFFYFSGDSEGQQSIEAQRGTIMEEVLITGKTQAAESVKLGFERSGTVRRVHASVGDAIIRGFPLVSLDTTELEAELAQAQADVASRKARLDELKRGTRPEEIQIQEAKVTSAKTALEDARRNLIDKLKDAFTKSDDAVRTKADEFISSPRSINPQLDFQLSNPQLEIELERGRVEMEATLTTWQAELAGLSSSSNLDTTRDIGKANLDAVKNFLGAAALALNTVSPTTSLTQTTIDGWKADISTGRTNVNTATANLTAADEKERGAEANVTIAENELTLKKAGTAPDQIAAQEALVLQAEANAAAVRAQRAKMILRSPINGTVTMQDAKLGEIAPANTALVNINSQDALEIEASIPEVDIGKVAVGNPAKVAIDAFPNEQFSAEVIHVDPAETIVDGVVNFKVRLAFERADPRFKTGLTANVTIETTRKSDVLIIPQFAIIERDDGNFVRRIAEGGSEEVKITIGIRGNDGNVEVLSGLEAGDRVENIGLEEN